MLETAALKNLKRTIYIGLTTVLVLPLLVLILAAPQPVEAG